MTANRNTGVLLARPLAPRSIIASLLLGFHPPRLPGSRLVRWCGAFGIAEGTARVALTRMVERGELTSDDGVYELRGPMRGRQAVQDWSRHPQLLEWAGNWRIAVVTGAARPAGDRAALRHAMRALRHAEVRSGVWIRPDNLPRAAASSLVWEIADAQCDWWSAVPEQDAGQLAADLFTPHDWAARAGELHEQLTRATSSLHRGGDAELAHAFEAGAATLVHVRADPLMPQSLLPARWPGTRLREAYDDYERVFGAAVERWFAATA
jgi:phenylacetic acid degradation operon negative regulatory protein